MSECILTADGDCVWLSSRGEMFEFNQATMEWREVEVKVNFGPVQRYRFDSAAKQYLFVGEFDPDQSLPAWLQPLPRAQAIRTLVAGRYPSAPSVNELAQAYDHGCLRDVVRAYMERDVG